MLINLIDDLPPIRAYIADRVRAQSKVGEPISAIEVGFRLDQACLVAVNFDTRAKHLRDGTWNKMLDESALKLPHWNEAYETSDADGISFVLLTGEPLELPAGAAEEAVAGVFGEALLAIALDAIAVGSFASLPLRDDCQLDLEEFDGFWAWPNEVFDPEAVDRTNEIRRMTPIRLPI